MVAWNVSGGILQLSELTTGEHRQSLARDFRELFHISINDIGSTVLYDEAVLLIRSLADDPGSWFQAHLAGWAHPVSRETMVLMDLHDLELSGRVKRAQFKPYPRPFDKKNRVGGKRLIKRTPAEVLAILTTDTSHPST